MKKNGNNTVSIVTQILQPLISEQNLILWDVQFEKEGSMWILRIIIDKEDGISLTDCEALSRPLDKLLDETDPIEQSYCLEVSSAGIERQLTKQWHYDESIGKQVQLRLIRPINGERDFIGKLNKYENDSVFIDCEGNENTFLINDLAYIRWYAEF